MAISVKKISEKPTAFVLVGLPGSGKSTWSRNHPRRLPVASPNHFIEEYAAEHNITFAKAFKKHRHKAAKLLKERVKSFQNHGESFIWDEPNLTYEGRTKIYKALHRTHRVIFVCFLVPLDICITQNEMNSETEHNGSTVISARDIQNLAQVTDFPQDGDPCDKIVRIIHPLWDTSQDQITQDDKMAIA